MLDLGHPARVASAVMATTALRDHRKNPHGVALGRMARNRKPLDIYGDLTRAQVGEHYSWMVSVRHARAARMPAPPAPASRRQRASRLRYGYNEYEARLFQADATAWRGHQSLIDFAERLPPNLQTAIRANLAVIARGVLEMLVLAGCAEPEKSEVARSLQGPLPNRG